MQFNLFAPPVIVRPATLAADVVFTFAGRALRVHRVTGSDPRAPVIVEELGLHKGQYALWSLAAVMHAISSGAPSCRK